MKKSLFALSLLPLCLLAPLAHGTLIAYWPFDDEEGEVAEDVVGGYDGTLVGGTWVTPGKVGASALLNN